MAESRLGAGRPYSSMLGIFCGTGVGGAGGIVHTELVSGEGAAELGKN